MLPPADRLFDTGLVVGKFAPLHRGHCHLIDSAAARCHRLVIVSWSLPEFDACGPGRRARWLQSLYPQHERWVITPARVRRWQTRGWRGGDLPGNAEDDATQQRFLGAFCRYFLASPVQAVFTSEGYGDGLAAHLARDLGQPVEHVCVDRDRTQVPISASAIRQDPASTMDWLPAAVRGDFIPRICLLGGESSGKSSLAASLAARLHTVFAAEYGRERWEQQQGRLHFEDMLAIARQQVSREYAMATQAKGWLICDTSPLTTLFYSQHLFATVDPALAWLARRPYDFTVLCAPDFPFVQDGTRADDRLRRQQDDWYRRELRQRGLPFVVAGGSLDERVDCVLRTLPKSPAWHGQPRCP